MNCYISNNTLWFHEATDPGNNHSFDAEIGYRISKVPSRFGAVTSDGHLESIGILRGNNLGFPDIKDFYVKKTSPHLIRIAVLGDSFTASQFTSSSWINRIEERINIENNDSVCFMNFSIDGGGLGNWSSIVKNVILKQGFEIDGIIFAVMGDDLDRKFMWKDDGFSPTSKLEFAVGYADSWNRSSYPTKRDQLFPNFLDRYYMFSSEEVDNIEKGNWKFKRPFKLYLFEHLGIFLKNILSCNEAEESILFEAEQILLIKDLAKDCSKLKIPVLTLSFLTDYKKTEAFSKLINSSYIDDKAFQKQLQTEEKKTGIKGDGHWNQTGADLFAKSMYPELLIWLKESKILN